MGIDVNKNIDNNEFFNKILLTNRNFINYIKFLFYIRKLKKLSPTFDQMLDMAKCLKLLELIYFFPNAYVDKFNIVTRTSRNIIYIEYKPSEYFEISIGLDTRDKGISIDISNTVKKTSQAKIEFKDQEMTIETLEDRQLFINIIRGLMEKFSDVLLYYYKNHKI